MSANLGKLDGQGIDFITLRRRSQTMLQEVWALPGSAWRQIHLEGISRLYRDRRIIDQQIQLKDYRGAIRQIVITELEMKSRPFC